MTKVKYLFAFAICMFVNPIITHADCDYERTAELSRIASNVNFSYTYDIKDNGVNFTVNAINIADDIYVRDNIYGTTSNSSEFNFNYNTSGQTITYDIYSKDPNCYGYKILTQNVNLPKYNVFNSLEQCQNYPDFKYCQAWLNTDNLTQDDFDTSYEKYLSDEDLEQDDLENPKISTTIVNIFENNKKLIIVTIICLIVSPFLFYLKRRMRV